MMLVLVLFGFIAVAAGFIPLTLPLPEQLSEEGSCNRRKFGKCTAELSKEWGIPITKNSSDFQVKLYEKFLGGGMDFDTFCGGANKYQKCLGSSKSCLSLENLKKMGLTDHQAYIYLGDAASISYQCKPDVYKILKDNAICIGKVFLEKFHDMGKCGKDWVIGIHHYPKQACRFDQGLMNCYSKLYSECRHPVSYVVCESIERSLLANMPQCGKKLTCKRHNRIINTEGVIEY